MKSRISRACLAFITGAAAVVGFAGPSQAASVEGQTYSFPLEAKAATSSSGNASGTVNGTMLDYTIFADDLGADVDSVVMHWHTGTSCDDSGGIELDVTGGVAVDLIDERFVIEGSIALGSTDMEAVYFNLHNAEGLTVLACGELDAGVDPLLVSPTVETIELGLGTPIGASGITAGGSLTLEGTRLQVNLDYAGNNLVATSRHMLMLRSSTSCDNSADTYLLGDNMRTVTTFGSTEMLATPGDGPGGDNSLIDVFNNTFWSFTAGVIPNPDMLAVDTELVLSPAEAEQIRTGGFSLVLHGNEANTNPDRTDPDTDGLEVREAIPANCLAVSSGFASGTPLTIDLYALEFSPLGASNIAGNAYLKNETTGAAGAVELITDLSANSPTDNANYMFVLHDGTCDAPVAPFGIGGDNPELGDIDANTGRLRTQSVLTNASPYTGPRAEALNNSEYVILVTNSAKTSAVSCASMSRVLGAAPEAPEPPQPFSGTVAEATTLEEIQRASNYRSTADNKGTDQEILRLYTAFFNREPDVAGVKYWIAVSKGEEGNPGNLRVYNTLEIAEFFMPQQEFINAFETVSDADFVETVYANVLGRPGDTEGLGYWNDILNGTNLSGLNPDLAQTANRGELVYYVALSQELVNRKPYAPIVG